MMSNGKRFRWITLLTLFMTVRSLRAAKQPRCNMTTGIARTGLFAWRNLIATEPKMLTLLNIVAVPDPFYFVGDAYYAAGKIAIGLLQNNNHLITRVKSNAIAYEPYVAQGPKKRGRPRLYGPKIALRTLLTDPVGMQQAPSPVYGEQNTTLKDRKSTR